MNLTDSEETLSEEQFLALETLHRSEGSAWFGRDPDLAEELDRTDEAAEAEVDPAQQRQLLRVRCGMVDAAEELSGGQKVISNVQSAKHDRCRELGQLCRRVPVSSKFSALS